MWTIINICPLSTFFLTVCFSTLPSSISSPNSILDYTINFILHVGMLCILWDRAIYMWIFYEIICKRVNQCNYALKEKKIWFWFSNTNPTGWNSFYSRLVTAQHFPNVPYFEWVKSKLTENLSNTSWQHNRPSVSLLYKRKGHIIMVN